jgi:hypothetical protein
VEEGAVVYSASPVAKHKIDQSTGENAARRGL